jgi:hypothetical protein
MVGPLADVRRFSRLFGTPGDSFAVFWSRAGRIAGQKTGLAFLSLMAQPTQRHQIGWV